MTINDYLKATALNVILVLAGAVIWPGITESGRFWSWSVYAQNVAPPRVPAKVDPPAAIPPPKDPAYEYIQPTISAGAALFGTVLAHQIATDGVYASDYNLLKLHENTLALLVSKGIAKTYEVNQLVAASRSNKPLRAEPPPPGPKK